MNLDAIVKRLQRLEKANEPAPPPTAVNAAYHRRALVTLGEALGEILGGDPPTPEEIAGLLASFGASEDDPLPSIERQARRYLCDTMGLRPEELTEDRLLEIMRGDDENGCD